MLHQLFMTAPARSIILIEDIDNFFVERTPTNPNQSVTFSGFINAIDGVGSAEGKIIIITTNNIVKLDAALLRYISVLRLTWLDLEELIKRSRSTMLKRVL